MNWIFLQKETEENEVISTGFEVLPLLCSLLLNFPPE